MAEKSSPEVASRLSRSFVIYGILVVIVLLAFGTSWYFYGQYKAAQQLLTGTTTGASTEITQLVGVVGKLIELPTDEQPTIATVADKIKLQDQVFFSRAENGDKVLIYSAAKKAILYRPRTNKIIEVGPVTIATSPTETQRDPRNTEVNNTPTPFVAKQLHIVLYNGTSTVGLTTSAEKRLKDKGATGIVIGRDTANKKSYLETIVVDMTGQQAELAKQYALYVGGIVGSLPSGESKPDATITEGKTVDLLIILGKDFTK